jgi:hypothetical protein
MTLSIITFSNMTNSVTLSVITAECRVFFYCYAATKRFYNTESEESLEQREEFFEPEMDVEHLHQVEELMPGTNVIKLFRL